MILVATVLASLLAPVRAAGQGGNPGELGDSPEPVSSPPESTGTEGALYLLLPVGAQGVAMGRAMSALSTQEGAFWNPAGLAGVDEGRFLVYRGQHLAGDATAFSLLASRDPIGTIGLSYQLLDVGELGLTDDQGNTIGSVSVRTHLAVVSFATALLARLDAGVNFKVIQFRAACRGQCGGDPGVTATTYAIDAGIQGLPLETIPLRLGAMIAHLGPRLQVVNAEQADPLPTRVRLSGAYEMLGHFLPGSPLDLWLSVELEDRWRDVGSPSLYVGSEFSAGDADVVFVRAGYIHGDVEQTNGPAVGMGLRFHRFDLGIAKSLAGAPLGEESEPIHVTFGVLF